MKTITALAAVLGTVVACASEDALVQPLHRLVDLRTRQEGLLERPTAAIQDQTRYVLRGEQQTLLFAPEDVEVGEGGRIPLRLELPAALRGATRVVLLPRLRLPKRWRSHPRKVEPVETDGVREFVRSELRLPEIPAGSKLRVTAIAYLPPEAAERSWETPALALPDACRLEFGIGILEPAWDQGPVRFAVQVCESGSCTELFSETLDPSHPSGQSWQDRAVGLGDACGELRSLRFETTHLRPQPEAFSFPMWSNPTVYARARRRADDTNVILFSVDTLRADHLTCYGYPLPTAPFMQEAFGRGGTIFENFVAAEVVTAPSHMSIFTSLHPSVHGVGVGEATKLPAPATTLAERLREHGFDTAAFTENGALDIGVGFARGFDAYTENKSARLTVPEGQVDLIFAESLSWLERNRDKRSFLFLHTYQVHHPYTPPESYRDLFAEPPRDHEPPTGLPEDWDPALYDREIRYVDDELRSFLRALEDLELADNTLVVLMSDHGEEFLEHGFIGHGSHVHAELTHVPLMFRGPGVAEGRRVAEPVAQVDLAPTILELAGAPPLELAMGRSFADRVGGSGSDGRGTGVPIYSEAWFPLGMTAGSKRVALNQPTLAVRVGDRKLIRYGRGESTRYEYFDLASDPRERRDRHREMQQRLGDLRALVDGYLDRAEATQADLMGRARAAEPEAVGEFSIDPEREEKLRALGYLD